MTTERHHILVVDDEEMSVELLTRIFADQPEIVVTGSTSPRAALELAREQEVDLVIADQRMPEMYGVDFIIALRKIHPEAVPIILTAYPELSLVIRALNDARIYKFLTKPCDPDSIQLTVQRALEEIDLKRENERLTRRLQRQNVELAHALDAVKSAEAELVRSEKMAAVGRLCAGLAHELSTPVTTLKFEHKALQSAMGTLARLADGLDEAFRDGLESVFESVRGARLAQLLEEARHVAAPESVRSAFEVCARAVGSMTALVSSLKTYSHPGSGRREPWDARVGIESALRMLEHRLAGRICVSCDFGEVPPIRCVGQEIGQVLLNVLGNAIDAFAGEQGGSSLAREIRVGTSCDGDMARIAFADNGCGMDKDTLRGVFRPFFTTKPVGRGTGLGLAISRVIVENHGGRIEVESELGRGTCVSILLPLGATSEETPAERPPDQTEPHPPIG